MRKLLPIMVAAVLLLMLVPTSSTWKWRTHGGVYGTRGISKVACDQILYDSGVSQSIKDGLNWELIRPGSIAPDKWYQEPYFISSRHDMTYSENQGGEWLLDVETAKAAEAWDNVSYYMGIASHYWSHVTHYTMHDNARSWFEDDNNYGEEVGYRLWSAHNNHLKWQVEYYRPKDPALIVQDGGTSYGNITDFVNAANIQIDKFITNTIDPDDTTNKDRWMWQWIDSHKCEASDYSVYHDGNIDNIHYGSKELVDMATELIYSGWVYALDVEGGVSADRITWEQWWSRSHREPGVVYI